MFNFSLSELYSKAKDTVSNIYNGVKSGVGVLKAGKDWISEAVDKLSAIPFVGEAVKIGVEKVENAPVFAGFSLHDLGTAIDEASKVVNSPEITYYGNLADNYLSGAARTADQAIANFT